MHQAVIDKGIDIELVLFDDEAHGFRNAENIASALQHELDFLP
jgi:dipeptidyl aminopeptidase/acylaminoacyl peptidase